jgi:hypothetical protein
MPSINAFALAHGSVLKFKALAKSAAILYRYPYILCHAAFIFDGLPRLPHDSSPSV